MKKKITLEFDKTDIAYALADYIKKQGYEMYTGQIKWIWEDGSFKHIECEVFKEE